MSHPLLSPLLGLFNVCIMWNRWQWHSFFSFTYDKIITI